MPNTDHFRVWAVMVAALAAAVLVLITLVKPAEAAFPGANGRIAFASNRETATNPVPPGQSNPDFEIFTMRPDGTRIEQITFNDSSDFYPAYSADGSRMAWSGSNDGDFEIYMRFFFGGTPVVDRLTNNTNRDRQPVFSPDGSKIAFESDGEIYVMDTTDSDDDGNGDNQTNLTNSPAGDYDPAFSPDGQKIAFMSVVGPVGTPAEIYVMDTDPTTNDATNLTNDPAEDYTPSWSPNGNKIAFTSEHRDINDPNNIDIYVMNALDGSSQKRLTRKAASDFDPAFSPDGKKIAFTRSANGGDNEIHVMKARPEGKRNRPKNFTNNNWGDGFADWQPVP